MLVVGRCRFPIAWLKLVLRLRSFLRRIRKFLILPLLVLSVCTFPNLTLVIRTWVYEPGYLPIRTDSGRLKLGRWALSLLTIAVVCVPALMTVNP